MPVIAENVVQLVAEYRNADTNMQNVYYVKKGSGWGGADLGVLVGNFLEWEATRAAPLRSNQVALTRVTATDLTSLTHGRFDLQLSAPSPGTRVSPALPASATWALKKNIGERGRGRNGRTFWIGLAEDQAVQDTIDSVAGEAIVLALSNLIVDMVAGLAGSNVGVIHRPAVGSGDPYSWSQQLTYSATDFLLDSQRDRLPGHKRHKRRPGVGA